MKQANESSATNFKIPAEMILIFLAALSRLLPHPPNFAPLGALALFGGAYFHRRLWAYLVPFAALLLSDVLIGFYFVMPWVYASYFLIVTMGTLLKNRHSPARIAGFSLASSLLFFLVTNFGEWISSPFYAKNWAGLFSCLTAALPFFRNSVLGDLSYCALLFGGHAWLHMRRARKLLLVSR